ncbi:MAG: transcriptional repressor [Dehalococcoidia bacterium]|nr:transcriptional repressor [Dehalococcoidia bacterium]
MAFTEAAAMRLETIGFRSTAPRRAVLQAIERAPGPFTVEDLLGELPGVGRATVFRTIKLLQELDLLCRVPLEDGSVRYQLSEGRTTTTWCAARADGSRNLPTWSWTPGSRNRRRSTGFTCRATAWSFTACVRSAGRPGSPRPGEACSTGICAGVAEWQTQPA